ncbi:DUF4345 family protein [Flammeovirga kamogawensis]|uniref:DUF4345 domain-containing protein n=1 Tax=Flammeovirga kamogawensis TaxID=373891 RepID=A0ABX8GTZ3_9BACT|nr:DUF4345 family protein [Flammeovirga kamogawensis]MBB6460067.1 hypothetical protein [Flammeovirga kamogawensis]QWG06889.1 DUF4345 domain-containing protein [Flammeovirga kamogawensis]TRX68711.1 DUF4345 domain-containing protein [Flammeovirga kamogawensis]
MEIVKIVILSLSSILLIFVGSMRLSNPTKTYLKNSGIKLENDSSLLNEMRGVSAVMLLAGILILLGIFFERLSFTSHVIAILIFIGFAIGRLISRAIDGKPSKQISQGIIFELILGTANIYCLLSIGY